MIADFPRESWRPFDPVLTEDAGKSYGDLVRELFGTDSVQEFMHRR